MKRLFPLLLAGAVAACGGSSPSSPSSTSGTTPSNHNPVISSMTVSPTFGISELTSFNFAASASDPDGDAIGYNWDLAGNAASGASGSIRFQGSGAGTVRLTVSDGKGGTASDTRTITVGSMTGTWRGTFDNWHFTSNLQQNGGTITGDYSDEDGTGRLDSASANTIDASGNVVLRYKQATFSDFTFRGTMDQTGRTITGGVTGSGYNGQPFSMTKQ